MKKRIKIVRATLAELVKQCQTYEAKGYEALAPFKKKVMYKAMYNKKETINYGIEDKVQYIIYMERKENGDGCDTIS